LRIWRGRILCTVLRARDSSFSCACELSRLHRLARQQSIGWAHKMVERLRKASVRSQARLAAAMWRSAYG
jgi:hypothetical protein